MIIHVGHDVFKFNGSQRAQIIANDSQRESVVIRSCGQPDVIAEVRVGKIQAVELPGLTLYVKITGSCWETR